MERSEWEGQGDLGKKHHFLAADRTGWGCSRIDLLASSKWEGYRLRWNGRWGTGREEHRQNYSRRRDMDGSKTDSFSFFSFSLFFFPFYLFYRNWTSANFISFYCQELHSLPSLYFFSPLMFTFLLSLSRFLSFKWLWQKIYASKNQSVHIKSHFISLVSLKGVAFSHFTLLGKKDQFL